MNKNFKVHSFAFYTALGVIILLAIFSFFTWKERMFLLDPSWIVFNIINTKSFVIAEHRYGAFISQMWPVMGVMLKLPLKAIMLLYNWGFFGFYLVVAIINAFWFKQRWLVVLQAVYLTLFVSDVFYWPNNEVHQGVAWMLLFFGLYCYKYGKFTFLNYVFLVAFLFLALFSHLLVTLPFAFIWWSIHTYDADKKHFKSTSFLTFSILSVILVFARYKLSLAGWYDPIKLEGVRQFSMDSLIGTFTSGQAKSFSKLLLTNYWTAVIIFILSGFSLLKHKKYLQMLVFMFFILCYFVLVCITFPESFGRSLLFYMESEWMALSIIIALPFVWNYLVHNRIMSLLFLSVILVRLVYIYDADTYFKDRFNRMSALADHYKANEQSKVLIIESNESIKEQWIMNWGFPAETMLLSKVKGDDVQTTIRISDVHLPLITSRDSFYTGFDIWPVSKLNPDYFQLDSTKTYEVIDRLQDD